MNRTIVRSNDQLGLIDDTGTVVVPLQYDYLEMFRGGKARAGIDGRFFFIDVNGNEVP